MLVNVLSVLALSAITLAAPAVHFGPGQVKSPQTWDDKHDWKDKKDKHDDRHYYSTYAAGHGQLVLFIGIVVAVRIAHLPGKRANLSDTAPKMRAVDVVQLQCDNADTASRCTWSKMPNCIHGMGTAPRYVVLRLMDRAPLTHELPAIYRACSRLWGGHPAGDALGPDRETPVEAVSREGMGGREKTKLRVPADRRGVSAPTFSDATTTVMEERKRKKLIASLTLWGGHPAGDALGPDRETPVEAVSRDTQTRRSAATHPAGW
ncbi:hypothetical protein BDZ89DRAFT_1119321 [Hymenopellis radicata]|nr:hypothetical protein BDZ89DRAFT_1119321 [Hymenopellis radicata]